MFRSNQGTDLRPRHTHPQTNTQGLAQPLLFSHPSPQTAQPSTQHVHKAHQSRKQCPTCSHTWLLCHVTQHGKQQLTITLLQPVLQSLHSPHAMHDSSSYYSTSLLVVGLSSHSLGGNSHIHSLNSSSLTYPSFSCYAYSLAHSLTHSPNLLLPSTHPHGVSSTITSPHLTTRSRSAQSLTRPPGDTQGVHSLLLVIRSLLTYTNLALLYSLTMLNSSLTHPGGALHSLTHSGALHLLTPSFKPGDLHSLTHPGGLCSHTHLLFTPCSLISIHSLAHSLTHPLI